MEKLSEGEKATLSMMFQREIDRAKQAELSWKYREKDRDARIKYLLQLRAKVITGRFDL